jgi:protein O-mannosyl-transferase
LFGGLYAISGLSRITVERSQRYKYYLAGLVSFLTFIIYLTALRNGFVEFDDNLYIYDNPHIRTLNLTFFQWSFSDFYAANWHPLTWISHALDYAIWGLNPLGHHLTNIIFHASNTFVVVLLVICLLKARKGPTMSSEVPGFLSEQMILLAAGVTGLLFGLHPLHVESVAWVAERKDLLCALFFLLSIMQYTDYIKSVSHGSTLGGLLRQYYDKYYLLAVVFFILALLSKPMAVTLPVVLLILDWYPFQRIQSFQTFRQALLEKIPFFTLSLFSSIITILAQRAEGAIRSTEIIPLSARVLVGAGSLVAYLWKILWPLDLVPYYPYPGHISILSIKYLSTIALVIGITVVCLVLAKQQKLWLTVWGIYVVTLLPVLGIVQVGDQSMADRYMYLPSLGPFLIMGLTAAWIWTKVNRLQRRRLVARASVAGVTVLVFTALSLSTLRQISVWKNDANLWDYIIDKEPHKVTLAYNNRGVLYSNQGFFDKASACFTESITINPECYDCYYNRGLTFARTGLYEKSLDDFTRALELNPNLSDAYYDRGKLYFNMGQRQNAVLDFQRACKLGVGPACSTLLLLTQESRSK